LPRAVRAAVLSATRGTTRRPQRSTPRLAGLQTPQPIRAERANPVQPDLERVRVAPRPDLVRATRAIRCVRRPPLPLPLGVARTLAHSAPSAWVSRGPSRGVRERLRVPAPPRQRCRAVDGPVHWKTVDRAHHTPPCASNVSSCNRRLATWNSLKSADAASLKMTRTLPASW